MPDTPKPSNLLDAWLAIEALQPQTFVKQEALLKDEVPRRGRQKPAKVPARLRVEFDISSGVMPWDTTVGDRQSIGLADDDKIRWYLPIAFIRMKPATEMLVAGFEPEGPEREVASGVSILAMVPFDEKGFPVTSGLILSSFGWACGMVLAGSLDELHRYNEVEEELRREIADTLVETAEDGLQIPTSVKAFTRCMAKAMEVLRLPKDILERPRVAIRVIGDTERDPVDIINSFYLRDLYRVKAATADDCMGAALQAYLAQALPSAKKDVLNDQTVLEELLAPRNFPLARWPAPMPTKLVTLQQAAVNAATKDLADGGLLAVNGPPGTGKTTLLRDIVAAVICERADRMAEFSNPERAFEEKDIVADGGYRSRVSALDPRLRGFGMVVASSNNGAVRNVSAELPRADAVSRDLGLKFFSGTADNIHGRRDSCWGLIAAVLGNQKNRSDFIEEAWWHSDWGLEKYLRAITRGRSQKEGEDSPAIVAAEDPPANKRAAMERWKRARLEYRESRTNVGLMIRVREQFRIALSSSAEAHQAASSAQSDWEAASLRSEAAKATYSAAERALVAAGQALEDARLMLDGHTALKPHAFFQLLGMGRKWRLIQEQKLEQMGVAVSDRKNAEVERLAAEERARQAEADAQAAASVLEKRQTELKALQEVEAEAQIECSGVHIGSEFWNGSHEEIHVASPWMDDKLIAARDRMFVAAINLHRAFIDAAAWPLKSNLGLIMQHIKGRRIPSGADAYLGDLWDTFFLMVPLISTTFASVDRLLDGLGQEAIGWLIVDEAGQATPQSGVGAVWRSRRALIIGDPLQIEPVATAPTGLVRAICTSRDVHPDIWSAPKASVQTLADAASHLVAALGEGMTTREIGLPLLVHRRCQDPMFSISNEIAYGGLMVHAPGDPYSAIGEALQTWFPGSAWIDVRSSSEKWSPKEGEAVVTLMNKLAEQGISKPSLYIISPFREVADKLRAYILKSGVLGPLGIDSRSQKKWAEDHVGTVHTFQGKEAEAVFLVLGASAEEKRGSRNWAGGTPNILNVAATRAKKVIYVIGHYQHWSRAGVFASAATNLDIVRWPLSEEIATE
ncbi:DEAD/DEAH box helicase [Kordiimonas aestuarii]|uniref:DEAD/DEAH box helicase n=1 Tax=Kordiimonas aestuarii TaxID=1005925 RepID=UPI0021D3DA16|nr:AAA domain-containing protein [Kordiimonas aestuarii]